MEKITVDEKDIKRIQKYVKRSGNLYLEIGKYNDEDFQLLAQTGEMTERLARQIIPELVEDAQRTRDGLEPNNEFKEQIQNVFTTFDTIPKLESYDQYANMDINAIYSNMQICLDLRELDDKFYMCRDLRNIANTVINSINGIDNYDINPEEKEDLEKIQEELRMLLSGNTIDMQGIQDRVNKYNEYAIQIWNNYITDVNGKKNRKFRYVVHNLTSGEIQGEFRTKYMSTSLITNNTMGLYGGSKCGFIIKPTHIISASDKDTFTNNYREDGEEVFNIKPSLKLPQEIEESCVEQTIEVNGEMLNYDMESIYSEIVVDEYEIIGVYCIDNGEKNLAPIMKELKKLQKKEVYP